MPARGCLEDRVAYLRRELYKGTANDCDRPPKKQKCESPTAGPSNNKLEGMEHGAEGNYFVAICVRLMDCKVALTEV